MANQEKISLYNLADLKNTSDDAIPNYLNSLKFKQSFVLIDVRLGLGYLSFAIAAACFAWDYKFGWDATKIYTVLAVGFYVVLSGCMTLWTSKVENGTIYQGTAPSGEEITITSKTEKLDPEYKLSIVVSKKGKEPQVFDVAAPFSNWFDQTGFFVVRPFQQFLASSVPLIGERDPKRALKASSSEGGNQTQSDSQALLEADPALLDAVLQGQGITTTKTTSTGADVGQKKKGSSRRKA